jgi:hypothetical protein
MDIDEWQDYALRFVKGEDDDGEPKQKLPHGVCTEPATAVLVSNTVGAVDCLAVPRCAPPTEWVPAVSVPLAGGGTVPTATNDVGAAEVVWAGDDLRLPHSTNIGHIISSHIASSTITSSHVALL